MCVYDSYTIIVHKYTCGQGGGSGVHLMALQALSASCASFTMVMQATQSTALCCDGEAGVLLHEQTRVTR